MFENLPHINGLNFFDLRLESHKLKGKNLVNKKYLMPNLGKYFSQEDFASIYFAYTDESLNFYFDVKHSFTKAEFPEYRRADSIEIFIDTRSLKTKGYLTKFCHHFVFFAKEVSGYFGKEVTRFKLDDMHNLADEKNLVAESIIKPSSYILNIEIPKKALFGFDPNDTKHISFTYRINRYQDLCQSFNVDTKCNKIEKNPFLWPKFDLVD